MPSTNKPAKPKAKAKESETMELTQEQRSRLEELRKAYLEAKKSGSADYEAKRDEFFEYANEILVELSGVLEPGEDKEPIVHPEKPTEGYVKEPNGWGADPNPDTWNINPMRDKPDNYKIIDNNSVNVATDFSTVATAAQYIAYAKWVVQQGEPGTGEEPTTGDFDKFGIKCIKKSAPNARFETKFELEGKERHYASGKDSEYSCEYTNVAKPAIENVEVTIYEKINGFKTSEPDSISLKMGGPPHKDGACCWLICEIMTDGSAKKTFQTEYPHPKYHDIDAKPLFKIGESIVGKWIGYKCTSQQTKDNKRHCETWIHFPVSDIENVKAEQDKWRKYISVDMDDKRFYETSGNLTTSRLDGVEEKSLPDFKYASVREIVQA